MEPKFPNVEVKLTGQDGNAFFIIGAVRQALRRAGVSAYEIAEFTKEATSADYSNVISTVMRWVRVS